MNLNERNYTMPNATDNYAGVWGHRVGFGQRAALLLIDFVKAYTLPESPLFAEGVVAAVACSEELLASARISGIPIIHTTISYQSSALVDAGAWFRKSPVLRSFAQDSFGEFCEKVKPEADEIVIHKQYASAFFGTSLASMLVAQGIDTVVMLGCTTSGCVRASAVDGVQHGFRVIVVRECVGDRHDAPHEANLFDIDAKYGDVVYAREVLNFLDGFKSDGPQALPQP